jgi:hypothetical protein
VGQPGACHGNRSALGSRRGWRPVSRLISRAPVLLSASVHSIVVRCSHMALQQCASNGPLAWGAGGLQDAHGTMLFLLEPHQQTLGAAHSL